MKSICSFMGRILYFLMGWTYDGLPEYWISPCVVIGFPHTSNMDTIRALSYIKLAGINARLLVKSDWFFFPMSVLLKSLGAVPVRRNKSLGFVDFAIEQFHHRQDLVLALVPEGTRKKVSRIRTGFWHIARGADVPIICWYLDNAAKKTRWVGRINPTDNFEQDMVQIQKMYDDAGFSIPLENFSGH